MQTQKLITTLPPSNVTHIPLSLSSNIWGAVRELSLIMFEIRLYYFHTLQMQRGRQADSDGACFRNIYYPIKMDARESSNYSQHASEMMNCVAALFSPRHIYLRSAGGPHPVHTLRTSSIFRCRENG